MVELITTKISDIAYEFVDKNGRRCGSVFTTNKYKDWLLTPVFPISDEFHEKKLYICESPEIAKERLEIELNEWLTTLKDDI